MKRCALRVWAVCLAAGSVCAADPPAASGSASSTNQVNRPAMAATVEAPSAPWVTNAPPASRSPERLETQSLVFQSELLTRIMGVPVTVEGAVPKAVKSRKPWHLINPWAPPEHGYGPLLKEEDPRGAAGWSILSIKF